ncbi:Gfo/Idh/MocA family oxidoreductase [Defluviimonas sp. WL0050]|uniref:Gfo/Idh/MocA family oxidoreductase n=1 Tax=Albidovulum litorale TaxID=2984134 RepID=A0ABT2ZQ50_9RHOB|nr:Gfo/Idh/MocA family oxidoreductase [Defluviimonas sp. WL0050]MCV2873287.1 Gfo/Idh/MocA family oxidoreductase [Defluviimonas sp. WL0050]
MRIGVIGAAGKIGQMRVATILAEKHTELVAVMDVTEEKARAHAHGAQVFTDLDSFLGVPMDAVVISTPAHVREPICLAAFKAGLHVLTEKPLSNTVEGARRIHAAAREAGRALGAGFNMRYYPAFAYVKNVLDQGLIGEIDHIRVYGGHGGLSNFANEWEYRAPMSGGGALWDVGIHMTDIAHYLMGDIVEIYGVASEKVWQVPGSEDNAMAIFKSSSGLAAIYQATWNDWKGYQSAVEVYGTKGMVRGAYAPMENLLITMDETGGEARTLRKRYFDIKVREKLKSWKTTAVQSFQEELADFIGLTEGRTGLRIADADAALRAVEIAVAVPESSRAGLPVRLPSLAGGK